MVYGGTQVKSAAGTQCGVQIQRYHTPVPGNGIIPIDGLVQKDVTPVR